MNTIYNKDSVALKRRITVGKNIITINFAKQDKAMWSK